MIRYKALIDVTVNGKKFKTGEEITERMAVHEVDFLYREGYIEELPDVPKKSAKKDSDSNSLEKKEDD